LSIAAFFCHSSIGEARVKIDRKKSEQAERVAKCPVVRGLRKDKSLSLLNVSFRNPLALFLFLSLKGRLKPFGFIFELDVEKKDKKRLKKSLMLKDCF
jgi:hypothetical protein